MSSLNFSPKTSSCASALSIIQRSFTKTTLATFTAAILFTACSQTELQQTDMEAPLATNEQISSIEKAVASDTRSARYVARDQYRHPAQTLAFFQVQPTDTVVEISPGGGWYTEVLAPLLHENGQLVAAHFPANSDIKYYARSRAKFDMKMQGDVYAKVEVSDFHPPKQLNIAKEGSADKVLTFRNVHNWMKNGGEQEAFSAFFKALKPGGIFGVVEHRAKPETELAVQIKSGYVTEAYVKELAQQVGFEFVAASEVNANPKDTKNYENGVWSLPPSLRIDDDKKQEQLNIGESDRMTLMFKKP